MHEVADELGVHYMTTYRYVRLGMLPARKVGSTWRVKASDVAEFRKAKASGGRPGGPSASIRRGGSGGSRRDCSRVM